MFTIAKYLTGLSEDPDFSVQISLPLAVQLLHRCIDEQEHVDAMYHLAEILYVSDRVGDWADEPMSLVLQLYSRCAAYGHTAAMFKLAKVLLQITPTIRRNVLRAVSLFQACVDACGHYEAMKALANLLMDGAPGVPVDYYRAVQLYYKCFEQQLDPDIMLRMTKLSASLEGFPREASPAVQLCERGIDIRFSCAKDVCALADLISRGAAGTRKDVELAKQLLNLCIEKGYVPEAKFILAKMYISEALDNIDLRHAMSLFEECLDLGLPVSKLRKLAGRSVRGDSRIPKNIPLAIRMYELCINKHNDIQSMCPLAEILVSEETGVQNELDRALQLCMAVIDGDEKDLMKQVLELAVKLARGTSPIVRDVPLAVQLCEIYIDRNPRDDLGVVKLVGILLSGTPRAEDIDRVIQLWRRLRGGDHYSANLLIKDVASGTAEITRDVPLAIRLSEMLAARSDNDHVLATLARLLLRGTPGPDVIQRVLNLCEITVRRNRDCPYMVELVMEVFSGTSEIEVNSSLAVEMCEICRENDNDADLVLAEIVLTGPASVRDTRRGLELIWNIADLFGPEDNGDNTRLRCLALKLAKGSRERGEEKALAVEVCEIWLENGIDLVMMITLAEVLLSGRRKTRRQVERAVELCARSVNKSYDVVSNVIGLAAKLADGAEGIERDGRVAVRLLEICIERWDSNKAMCVLADILSSGAPGVAQDSSRASALYQTAVQFEYPQ